MSGNKGVAKPDLQVMTGKGVARFVSQQGAIKKELKSLLLPDQGVAVAIVDVPDNVG